MKKIYFAGVLRNRRKKTAVNGAFFVETANKTTCNH
jgi:hypothetical protein